MYDSLQDTFSESIHSDRSGGGKLQKEQQNRQQSSFLNNSKIIQRDQ